jgi:tetratricopeptide (TPR) repeat protein
MAEHMDEAEAEASPAGGVVADGGVAAGIALALGAPPPGGKLPPETAEFLQRQGRLVELQMEHLHEQRELILSRLRWGRFSDRMKAAIQVMTALVGLAVVAVVGAMAWHAHEDHGVRIEAFSVAPDLAQRGLTGQVVASRLLDKLAALQAKTVTARPASTYANDWGGDIKVEIPETGVSIGELNRYLRDWLGSETRISGDVVRTSAGLAVTARAGADPGATFEGPDADLDRLMQQAAEEIYAQTQPYRYAVYLASTDRKDEALAAFTRLAQSGAREDRPWAYAGWSSALLQADQPYAAAEKARAALALDPGLIPAYIEMLNSEDTLQHGQATVSALRDIMKALKSGHAVGVARTAIPGLMAGLEAGLAQNEGDYLRAARAWTAGSQVDLEGISGIVIPAAGVGGALINAHDIAGGDRVGQPLFPELNSDLQRAFRLGRAMALDDWAQALAATDGPTPDTEWWRRRFWPPRALALAESGRFDEASQLVGRTPLDCDGCLVARGSIAALAGDGAQSRQWFQRAADQAPLSPLAYTEWGRALLAKGDLDGAIGKLEEAHRRGPHYADPLELWGEALMRMGDLKGAAAKFAEADQYAPRWGRNHLRWGEALMLTGRYAEARRQFEAANSLDLSKPDRAALNVLLARTASGPLHG